MVSFTKSLLGLGGGLFQILREDFQNSTNVNDNFDIFLFLVLNNIFYKENEANVPSPVIDTIELYKSFITNIYNENIEFYDVPSSTLFSSSTSLVSKISQMYSSSLKQRYE